MAQIIEATNWESQPWQHTGGTRNKKILVDENEIIHYFKESLNKENRKHIHEFYSEVIASFLGEMIGLNVLHYDIAIHGNKVGCISKSMIDPNREELIEGVKYITAFDNTFIIENKNPGNKYTFQIIVQTLKSFSLEKEIDKLIDTILFDTIIGNVDRHQENWAFIATRQSNVKDDKLGFGDSKQVFRYSSLIKSVLSVFKIKQKQQEELLPFGHLQKLLLSKDIRFSPIYDSGSSLAREIDEDKAKRMIKDQHELSSYINRGLAEIHWDGTKLSHFNLVKKLIAFEDGTFIKSRILEICSKINFDKLSAFIDLIDLELPKQYTAFLLPNYKKELIVKLIASRALKLREIINE